MADRFPVAERFKAPQGEGLYTGTPMAFIRFVGCSVGQAVCHACDTDFDRIRPDLGGGHYSVEELRAWASPYEHICLTGGEPLDRDIRPIIIGLTDGPVMCHVETSGTVWPAWLDPNISLARRRTGSHSLRTPDGGILDDFPLWVTVSPKPGYLEPLLEGVADELKVILGGLGDGPGWPTLEQAASWAWDGPCLVYIQPRNHRLEIDPAAMKEALEVIDQFPVLRLSMQAHKYIRTR